MIDNAVLNIAENILFFLDEEMVGEQLKIVLKWKERAEIIFEYNNFPSVHYVEILAPASLFVGNEIKISEAFQNRALGFTMKPDALYVTNGRLCAKWYKSKKSWEEGLENLKKSAGTIEIIETTKKWATPSQI